MTLRYTHDGIETVKAKLEKIRKDALPTGNPYLNKFSRDGTLYAEIEVLGSTTELAELPRQPVRHLRTRHEKAAAS